jgi:signal transduction histidine kinase
MLPRPLSAARRVALLTGAPLAVVLLLILAATVLIGAVAWQAASRQQALEVELRRSEARIAAQQYAGRIGDELYLASMAILKGMRAGRFDDEGSTPGDLRAMLSSSEAERCRCAAPVRPRYAFRLDADRPLEIVGDPPVSAEHREWLRHAIRDRLSRSPRGWDVTVLPEADVAANLIIVAPEHRARPDSTPIIGFAVDTASLARWVFRPLLSQRNRLAAKDSGAALAARVRDVRGQTLFASAASLDSQFAATFPFADIWSGLEIEGALTPLPGQRLPAIESPLSSLGMLLAIAVLLVGTGLALVWRAVQLARMRTDFTSSVSHELRTPLTQILLYAETIELGRHESPEEATAAAGVISREARRLMHLVQNVLHFSRAEHGRDGVHPRAQPIGPIVEATVEAFEPLARAKRMCVRLVLDRSVKGVVDADAARQVVLNFLDNAVRHGGERQTITVVVERKDDWARIAVEDEGPGIDERDRRRVWDPFVRLADGEDARTGCGIGLTIVRDLVRQQGGRYGIESREGRGARFYVELPVAR